MGKLKVFSTLFKLVHIISDDTGVQKILFGVYSDGTPRSLADSLHGEYLSPKDRIRLSKKKRKKLKRNYKSGLKI